MSWDPSGLALLVDTLHHGLPADVAGVLADLGDAELAAGLEGAELPIAVAVGDFVVARGGPASAAALTRRALAGRTVAEPHGVLRGLVARAETAVDEALFFPQPEGPHRWARQAVLRDRVGPDGWPVLDRAFRDRVAVQLTRIEQRTDVRPGSHSRTEDELLEAVLGGDDAELINLALPAAVQRGLETGVLRGVAILALQGRLPDRWKRRLRANIVTASGERGGMYRERWKAALRIGDAMADGDTPDFAGVKDLFPHDPGRWDPRRLPAPERRWAWTSPGIVAGRYTVPWSDVMARAEYVDNGSCPGLEEAATREDLTPAMREELEAKWARAAFFVPRPDADAIAHAQREARRSLVPASRHFAIREMAVRGLTHHALTAAEVLWTLSPAAEALALAAPVTPALEAYLRKHRLARHPVPSAVAERSVVDVRHAAADLLRDSVGEDPDRWRTLLLQVGAWPGTFGELVSLVADGADLELPPRRAGRWPRGVDAAAVLLTLAPAKAADLFLAEAETSPAVRGAVTRILDRGPIPPALVDHALGPQGTPEMRRALARNPESALGLLVRLIEGFPAEREMLAVAYIALGRWRPAAGGARSDLVDDLRARIVLHSEANGGLHSRLRWRFRDRQAELAELRPALASQDPVTLHTVLARINGRVDPGHRARAYAALASLAGPEPVWALELQRAGTLERASASVRASMAAGDIGPIVEAADLEGVPSYLRVPLGEMWPFEPDGLDGPALPTGAARGSASAEGTAELVRAELDGRADRWRTVAAAWTQGPATPLDALLREGP
jgi:hypothetical protein